MNTNKTLALAVAALMAGLGPVPAIAQAPDAWAFSLTPYVWLPGVNGDINHSPPGTGGGSPSVSVDADDLLSALDFAGMISGSAQSGRWLVATDLI